MNVFQVGALVLGAIAVSLASYALFRVRRDLVAMREAHDALLGSLAGAEAVAKEALAASRRVIHMLEAQSKADQN